MRLLRRAGRRSLARRLFATEEAAPGVLLCKALNILPWDSRYGIPKGDQLRRHRSAPPGNRHDDARARRVVDYDPGAVGMMGSLGEEFAIYDCVDDYTEQATSPRKRAMVARCDRVAAARSRLVFATSTTMYERHARLNRRTHLVPNAGDYTHFAQAAESAIGAPEVTALPRPVLGFAGNFLASKVDFDLLEELARALSESTLLLIGPAVPATTSALERLTALPNVRWLGEKPYAELPRYVAAFDVGLIPYVANAYTRSCFPLKLYEYLAAGKPVVASGVPELAGMEPDVVLADGARAFVEAVQDALKHDGEAGRLRRKQLAARNSWETKTERLLELVRRELEADEPAD